MATLIAANQIRSTRIERGFVTPPQITIAPPRSIVIEGGEALLPNDPNYKVAIAGTITLPSLQLSTNVVSRWDNLYLVSLMAEVGAVLDGDLVENFQYRERGDAGLIPTIKTRSAENTRRLRSFWGLVFSEIPLNAETLNQTFPNNTLTIQSTAASGFQGILNQRFYALDPNWVAGGTYKIFPEQTDVFPFLEIRRVQRYPEQGYTWGFSGEANLEVPFHVRYTSSPVKIPIEQRVGEAIHRLFSGLPLPGNSLSRTVQNLTGGSIPHDGLAGLPAGSPNSSIALANDQRVSFTNEARVGKYFVQRVIAADNGNALPLVTATLNSSAPVGSFFSTQASDHAIYTLSGANVSSLGTWVNLGNSASLTWKGSANSGVTPGDTLLIVPGVRYPAGSGFNVGFLDCEAVWRNTVKLDDRNVLRGDRGESLTTYTAPFNEEAYWVLLGRERAALHYILKKVTLTSSAEGILTVPSTERGLFAFVQGVTPATYPVNFSKEAIASGQQKINRPILTGLPVSTTFDCLIYYPPRTTEYWQLQLAWTDYQGTREISLLDGARVISRPRLFVHSQGGGTSVFQGEGAYQFSPISFYLPKLLENTINSYDLNNPIHFEGASYVGPDTFAEVELRPANAFALPQQGQVLSYTPGEVVSPQSLVVAISHEGRRLGFRTPRLQQSNYQLQAVLTFAIEIEGTVRLLVATKNVVAGDTVVLDADLGTAIDLFRI